ncbi:MAG TPA: hypothetical protein VES38_06850 [Methylotenera sp.]|nr:hypothetical protein [Methylotenera sp.]
MNTYQYNVTNLLRDVNDIVIAADFTITASDGVDQNMHSFTTAFNNKPVTPIAFNNLTQEKVISWIKRDVGEVSEAHADAELAAYKERHEVTSGIPNW